ncbi:MAG: hypothetical protein DRP28_01560 [Thermodesulfobacteriota bacterium]|nr:MAG: hypothetical protein DRP28_01560 [Thermodesulfobacteriota bacterium]
MNLLFYAREEHGVCERLQRLIEGLVSEDNIEICMTIESLSQRLRQPTYDLSIAVLLAADSQDLTELLSIRDLIWDLRLILILPDRETGTIAKGHTLRPRFLTYLDSDFADVTAVLKKMLSNTDGNFARGSMEDVTAVLKKMLSNTDGNFARGSMEELAEAMDHAAKGSRSRI